MKRRLSSVVFLLTVFIAVIVAGCSVKEDRSGCPCRMVFDFSEVDEDVHPLVNLDVTSADGILFHDTVDIGELSGEYGIEVPKGWVYANVYDGADGFFFQDKGVVISEGMECPPVFFHSERVNTDCEFCVCAPVLHKNFCNVTISLAHEGVAFIPFSMRIKGNVCGYDLSGKPVPGMFVFSPELTDEGTCSVRIPRQTDSSLKLEIVEDGSVLREFALGEFIIESGYDWSAPDLEDVEVMIDYSKTDVIFIVDDWVKEFRFEVVI